MIPVILSKVPLFHGSLSTGATSFAAVMSEGRCLDRGNFSSSHLSGSLLSGPAFPKAR